MFLEDQVGWSNLLFAFMDLYVKILVKGKRDDERVLSLSLYEPGRVHRIYLFAYFYRHAPVQVGAYNYVALVFFTILTYIPL